MHNDTHIDAEVGGLSEGKVSCKDAGCSIARVNEYITLVMLLRHGKALAATMHGNRELVNKIERKIMIQQQVEALNHTAESSLDFLDPAEL